MNIITSSNTSYGSALCHEAEEPPAIRAGLFLTVFLILLSWGRFTFVKLYLEYVSYVHTHNMLNALHNSVRLLSESRALRVSNLGVQ